MQAVRFLHEAGILLHYEEAALQLSDLYFVNPEWLCRMMAQVITVREINPYITPQGVSAMSKMVQLGERYHYRHEPPDQFTPPPMKIPRVYIVHIQVHIIQTQPDQCHVTHMLYSPAFLTCLV